MTDRVNIPGGQSAFERNVPSQCEPCASRVENCHDIIAIIGLNELIHCALLDWTRRLRRRPEVGHRVWPAHPDHTTAANLENVNFLSVHRQVSRLSLSLHAWVSGVVASVGLASVPRFGE